MKRYRSRPHLLLRVVFAAQTDRFEHIAMGAERPLVVSVTEVVSRNEKLSAAASIFARLANTGLRLARRVKTKRCV